jgi:hypothetical protein
MLPQYMNHRNRWGRLERAGQLYNRKQGRRIATLLCDMTAKAVRVRDAADAQLTALLELLATAFGRNTSQVYCLYNECAWDWACCIAVPGKTIVVAFFHVAPAITFCPLSSKMLSDLPHIHSCALVSSGVGSG